MSARNHFRAMVERIYPQGRHGPYAVARSEELGSVTFSLEKPTWRAKDWPDAGTMVVLSNLRRKRAGWRAGLARYVTPSDEASASS